MNIKNQTQINELIENISVELQKLEELLYNSSTKKVNIRFPRKVIRTADYFRSRLVFISDDTLRTNIAYHLMLSDVYQWILNRFDIALTAKELLIKEGISLMGNIIEAIIVHIARNITSDSKDRIGFKKACTILVENKIITAELKRDLMWVWGMRCKEHLPNLKETEYKKYELEHYNKTIKIWHDFENQLKKWKENIKINNTN